MSKTNKGALIAKLRENGFSAKDAEDAVRIIGVTITDSLKSGDEVSFVGFGTFRVATVKAHEATNPQTKEKVHVSEHKTVRFHASRHIFD